ncbi:hypothetical protein FRB95_007424 [Tulasnella sp. JGI-2019a]|nr:hypothetical protein FRB95_007424 [Tulasnella sp. JGI-2019a]
MALLSNLGMVYVMVTRHKFDTTTTFSGWVLPIIPTIVVATTGCIVAGALAEVNAHYALLTTLVSVCSVTLSLTIATLFLVLYTQRLILHGFPVKGTEISVFIPLGPLGQSGYCLLLAGNILVDLLPSATSQDDYLASPGVAESLGVFMFSFSVITWIFGIWFLVPAVIRLIASRNIPFGLSSWSLIFPTGVYTVLTLGLAHKLNSSFLKVLGAIYSLCVFAMFTTLAIRTVHALPSGSMFVAPCLNEPVTTKRDPEPDVIQMSERDQEVRTLQDQEAREGTEV